MPQTPDRFPGVREDEGIILESSATLPTVNGELRYVTGVGFRFYEEGVSTALSGSGITVPQHKQLDTLVHEVAESNDVELIYSGPQLTSIIYWTDGGHTLKIREAVLTYSGDNVTTIVTKQYAPDGSTVVEQVSTTLNYTGDDVTGLSETFT
jgi:hypothetical protein